MRGKLLVLAVAVALLAFFTLACTDTTEAERVDTTAPDTETDAAAADDEAPAPTAEIFGVGDTVKMGDLHFTVNSGHWDTGDGFMEPDDGERWLVLDCTLENIGSESSAISSLMMFKLVDEESYSRDLELLADTKGSLDGELAAGSTMRGQIAFSVEEGQTAWELVFEPNVFGFGQARYTITEADLQ